MKTAQLINTSNLSLPDDSYVYQILPNGTHLAATFSDDSLRLIDPATLQSTNGGKFSNVHAGITSVRAPQRNSNVLITSGRDAKVKSWDLRTGAQPFSFQSNNGAPFLSLACNETFVAAGTELTNHQAILSIWDYRNPSVPVRQYVESHNDDISELAFHPTKSLNLLSGSTDSLINIYDTSVADEDEALISITNHGSSIHHAGFLSEDSFFGLSHDESFSLYHYEQTPQIVEEATGSDHIAFGDLRELLGCEYVVDVLSSDTGSNFVCAGSHSRHHLDLIPFTSKPDASTAFDKESIIRLAGAHGDEIVRSACFGDGLGSTIFTGGEDGYIKAWRLSNEDSQSGDTATPVKRPPSHHSRGPDESDGGLSTKTSAGKKPSTRFKPY